VRATLTKPLQFQNLQLPAGTQLEWNGHSDLCELKGNALAGTMVNGVDVVVGSTLCIEVRWTFWSAVLDGDLVVGKVRAPMGARVEWLFGFDTFACEQAPRPFQIDFASDFLFEEKFDAVQLSKSGDVNALRAALATESDGCAIPKGHWLFRCVNDRGSPHAWTDARGGDPAMRHYDGSGGADV